MRTNETIAALLLVAGAAQAGQAAQEAEWVEDSTGKREAWERQLGGEAYQRALEATGMAAALGAAPLESAGVWTRSGPQGGFGGGNSSGRIASVDAVDIGGNVWIYAGASGGGLYRCQFGSFGVWEELGANLPNPSVRAFSVNPSDPDDIVVGTGDWMRYRGSGIYRTTGGGDDWPQSSTPASIEHVFRIHRAPYDDSLLVAATDKGILRSTDGGDVWLYVQLGGADITGLTGDLAIHEEAGLMFAVVQGQGLLQSYDFGATWMVVTHATLPPAAQWGRGVVAICQDDPDTIAVAYESNKQLRGVYRSSDGGSEWTDVTPTLPASYHDQVFHALTLAIRPTDPDELLLGTVGISRSYWDEDTLQLEWLVGPYESGIQEGHSDYTQLFFDPLTTEDTLWQASDGGLFAYSLSGGFLINFQGNGPTGLAISQVDQLDADRNMLAIGLQDNGVLRTVDAGQTWKIEGSGDGGDVRITDPEQWDYWFGKNSGNGWEIERSEYSGSGPETVIQPPNGLISSIHYVPRANKIWASNTLNVYSADAAASLNVTQWTDLWKEEILGGIHPGGTYAIARLFGSPIEDETLFVPYRDRNDFSILHKPQGSWVFNLVPNIGTAPSGVAWPVNRVTPSLQWPGECWISLTGNPGSPKIQHIVNHGANPATDAEDLTANLDPLRSVWIVEHKPFDPTTLYAGTDLGVFRSVDAGASWQPFQDGMPICQVKDMVFVLDDAHTGNHVLHVATYGHGTWRRTIPATPILYVDPTATTATEDGTFEHPFDTIGEAVTAAPAGAVVAIRAADYAAPLTVSDQVRLVTWAGKTTVK